MNKDEFNKLVDSWFAIRKNDKGKLYKLQLGMYPPNKVQCLHFGQNNKLASEDLIRHYADALGDANPLWRDPSYGRNTRYGGIIAPPSFIVCIAPTYGSQELTTIMGDESLDVPGFRSLNAACKYEWFRVIHAGDGFSVFERYCDVEEKKAKEGRPYRLFLETTKRTYVNQRDEVVAVTEARTIVIAAHEAANQATAFAGQKVARYTTEELERIDHAYEAQQEYRRGAEVLYWEDVVVGEDIKPLVAGPITSYDAAAFFQGVGYASAFDIEWAKRKAIPAHFVLDPETGLRHNKAESHISERVGRVRGNPTAYAFAAQSEGLICRMICNWMGDDGFLKKFDSQAKVAVYHYDTHWVKGKVVKKYVEGDEHLIDLECSAEKQDGTVHMPATATVRLFSREGF